jgi:hypothetical protein
VTPATAPPSGPPAPLVGLGPEQAAMTAEDFFAAFSWKPMQLDPDSLSAEEFLSAL